MLNRTNEQA